MKQMKLSSVHQTTSLFRTIGNLRLCSCSCYSIRPTSYLSESVWIPDNRDGTYKNPIIYADYSDPDVDSCRRRFLSNGFEFQLAPGLPILHSKDLVNWRIIGHALQHQTPVDCLCQTPTWQRSLGSCDQVSQQLILHLYPRSGLRHLHDKGPQSRWPMGCAAADKERKRMDRSVSVLGRRWQCLPRPRMGQ